jgi:hypothetical protein
MPTRPIARFFAPDPRFDGVRPVQIWGLRLFYFLMLVFVAFPLWQAGTLWGTPSGEVAASFLALPLLAAVVPWGYAWRMYFAWPRRK